ncbi:MAG: oligosaccharide flippase family protein [Bacilli bacterium]|nr:oligosaccharide flippase family protein [Bacilli bacterium]
MKANQIKIGAILSYLQMAFNVAINLIYTPVMIKLLGKSEYGLYNTVASTISLLTILNLGFSSSYIRFFSVYKSKGENEKINSLNGLFLIVFLIISLISFLCGLFLTSNIQLVFDNGLTKTEYEIARVLMFLLTLNLSISFPMSLFSCIISAHEKFIFLKAMLIGKTVLSPILSIPLMLLGYGSISIVIVTLVVSLVVDISFIFYCFAILKTKFKFKSFEKGIFGQVFVFTIFIAINLIVDQINLNIDKLLLGRFKGTDVVAVYSVGFTLYMAFQQFSLSISGLFAPRIHSIINSSKNRDEEISNLFIKVGRIQFLILGLICTGFIFFGQQFLHFWVGDSYTDAYYVMLILCIPSMIALTQNIGIEVQRALNKHKFRSIAYLIMALVNLVLSIFLAQQYGAIGSAIGTGVSLILANGLVMNIYYYKQCGIDIVLFWKNIIRISFGLVIPVLCGVLLSRYFPYDNFWLLLIAILIYTAIYCASMWLTSMNKYEKGLVLSRFSK